MKRVLGVGAAMAGLAMVCSAQAQTAAAPAKTYIVGQDFGSVRDYYLSRCCVLPDGATTYLGFYDLLKAPGYGGLGMDEHGKPADDADWGAGPSSLYKTLSGLPGTSAAVGLSLAEAGHTGGLKHIADGTFDDEIDQLGRLINRSTKTVYLRIGYEFDGPWNDGYGNAEAFVAAWRHIVDRLRAKNVTNVRYVWQDSCSPLGAEIRHKRPDIADWYPGDAYVDFAAMSWFLDPGTAVPADKTGFVPPTQGQLRDDLMAFAAAHGKPVMIAESTPQGYDLKVKSRADITAAYGGKPGQDRMMLDDDAIWGAWYRPLFDYLETHPQIRVLAYINADWDHQRMWGRPYANGYWGNSRLQDNAAIAAKWNAAIARWKGEP